MSTVYRRLIDYYFVFWVISLPYLCMCSYLKLLYFFSRACGPRVPCGGFRYDDGVE